ncbi:MAG: LPS assembly protein LptD, partial [Pontiellaceae bacterium]|nr:LPS assembly protein LptD [Pontiellaceae bacterium]
FSAAQEFQTKLNDLSAKYTYETGRFYERIPRPAKNESADIYYQKTLDRYGGTVYAEKAAARQRKLLPLIAATKGIRSTEDIFNELIGKKKNDSASAGEVKSDAEFGGERVMHKPLPARISTDDEAFEITADRMEYADDLLICEGNVAVQQKSTSVQADRVAVNSKTGDVEAKGNILLIRDGGSWEGQRLTYNYKTHEGVFGESFMYFEPVYITAGSTERISTNEFLMRDATMTTCAGDNPVVYARAKEIRVVDEQKPGGVFVQAKQVAFYVGSVPVFYVPVWTRHLGYRMFTTTVGGGNDLGAFVMIRAELHPAEWLTANTHLDLYSRRGVGLGQDFSWLTPDGKGGVETYYIHDLDPEYDDDDTAAERALIDPQRYRIKLTHREQLADETCFSGQLNWLSDPAILRDFFNDEYQHAANPENYAVVQHSAEKYAASLRVDRRLNDFYTSVSRIPELTYDLYRSRVGNSPLFFESENNASFLERLHEELPGVVGIPNYRGARVDTHDQIFMPLRFREFYNVIPRAGYRGTWYSDTETGDPELRNFCEFGTLTSFKAYKTLTEKSGFYGTGMRHILEPYADYSYRSANLHTNEIFQFDSVDALDEENEVRFGARNFLQSRRGVSRLASVLDSDVYTAYRLNPPDGERAFGGLGADAELSLTDNFFLQSDLQYNWYTDDFTPVNAHMKWVTDDLSEYSFEYRYLSGTRSLFTPRVKLLPNDKWSCEASVSYDEMYNEWFERKITVTHTFDCIGAGAGIKLDEDDDIHLWFQLWLTAFPQGVFGM